MMAAMRTLLGWLGVAAVMAVSSATVQAGTPTALKPYVVLILDTSGSMTGATNSGPPSCGGTDTKIEHARCAINNIVNSYGGDMVFAFGKFRETPTGTYVSNCATDCNTTQLVDCTGCNTGTGAGCPALGALDDNFQLVTALQDGNSQQTATYTDFQCNTCAEPFGPNIGATNPEIMFANSWTPLNGSFRGAKDYWLGLEKTADGMFTIWPATLPGYQPIQNDPTNQQFLPTGCDPSPTCTTNCCATQCRPYITIMLTDGDETCSEIDNAWPTVGASAPFNIVASPNGTTEKVAIAASPNGAVDMNFTITGANGATEAGNTATFRTTAANPLVAGDTVVVSGVPVAGYNGTWTVATIVSTTRFTVTLPVTGLGSSGGGTVATAHTTFTTTAAHGLIIGDTAVVAGVGVAGYNGTWTVTAVPSATTFIATVGTVGLAASGGGTVASRNATFTTTAAHNFVAGDSVVCTGIGVAGYNGTWTVTSIPTTTTFTAALGTTGLADSGGGQCVIAPGLLGTDVVTGSPGTLKRYHVVTKPIGFGTPVPYAQIENIAHAGGAPDIPGQNEGYYAADEAGLELAMSQIIESSLRSESCNNLDDDCDGAIDEDFPLKGQACDNGQTGVCKGTGVYVCRADGTGVQCNITNPGQSPQTTCPPGKTCSPDGTETCNDGLDNDCDGAVDEGCTVCVPTAEICNGKDDNCNGLVDDGIPPRQCSNVPNAACSPNPACCGTQTCSGGSYGACSATVQNPPPAETCNNKDDDCDGIVDEDLTKSCSNITGNGCTTAPCPATNNPGDPSHMPIPQNICHPGQQTCSAGNYGACVNEQTPQPEICDGLDNDCDNKIDEDTGGGPCNANCGVGTIVCAGSSGDPNAGQCCMPGTCMAGQHQCGTLYCTAQPTNGDYTCNNVDDDCDNKVDEDWACSDPTGNSSPAVPCACTAPGICNGQNKCINGQVVCQGTPIDPSSCCDCNGNPQAGACTGGASCAADCTCAYPCSGGEFPCPVGEKCTNNFCIVDPCYTVTCPPVNGNKQTCVDQNHQGVCVDTCSTVTCSGNEVCVGSTGMCEPNDCTTFPNKCTTCQQCQVDSNGVGQCITDMCCGVTCPTDQYCEGGMCYGSCAGVNCKAGETCVMGTCQPNPCGSPCPQGEVCDPNLQICKQDTCISGNRMCPQGQACDPVDGQCKPDPCLGVTCPGSGQVCKQGTCNYPATYTPDGGSHVTVGGGGCSTTGGCSGLLVALALILVRRRRGGGAS
jgi:hypothetical protein